MGVIFLLPPWSPASLCSSQKVWGELWGGGIYGLLCRSPQAWKKWTFWNDSSVNCAKNLHILNLGQQSDLQTPLGLPRNNHRLAGPLWWQKIAHTPISLQQSYLDEIALPLLLRSLPLKGIGATFHEQGVSKPHLSSAGAKCITNEHFFIMGEKSKYNNETNKSLLPSQHFPNLLCFKNCTVIGFVIQLSVLLQFLLFLLDILPFRLLRLQP